MIESKVPTWEEYEERLRELEEKHRQAAEHSRVRVSELLYRGQPDIRLKLQTTLERQAGPEVSFLGYYKLALAVKSRVETFTDKTWPGLPDLSAYEDWLKKQDGSLPPFFREAYDYLAYLRHYGFPSPLLDWTASPYVAAFFAFDKVDKTVEYVSIYALWEYAGDGKNMAEGSAVIRAIGPNARVHPRHFLQQSQYSICGKRKDGTFVYCPHEEVAAKDERNQGVLWKFNLPASEREKVMRKLHKMNVNRYSLFGTEDSLIDMLATTELLHLDGSL